MNNISRKEGLVFLNRKHSVDIPGKLAVFLRY